jgi:hypothetical protein
MIRLGGLVHTTAVNLLFEDQWDLLRPLFDGAGPWVRFDWQHGPHRQGLGGLLVGWLYGFSSWDVRAEAWAGVAILGGAAAMTVALSARLRGRLAWSDAAFPLLILAPVHWETLLLTPNLAHSILPLALVLGVALAWTFPLRTGSSAITGSLTVLALFTGFGLCGAASSMSLALGLFVFGARAESGVRRADRLLVLIFSAIGMVLFGFNYHWNPAVPGWTFPVKPWWDYGRFVGLMYTSLLGWREITTASTLTGLVMFAAVFAAFVTSAVRVQRGVSGARDRAVFILTGTSLCYGLFTAVGRLPVNIEAAFMWRYTTLMMPGLVGLSLAAEAWARPRFAAVHYVIAFVTVVMAGVVWSNFEPERQALSTAAAKRRWIDAYLKTHNVEVANRDSDFFVYFPAPGSPEIKQRLDFLEAHRLSFFRQQETPQ